jgi:hypothetical protein
MTCIMRASACFWVQVITKESTVGRGREKAQKLWTYTDWSDVAMSISCEFLTKKGAEL